MLTADRADLDRRTAAAAPAAPIDESTREKLRDQLRRGDLDERLVDIETQDRSTATIDFIGGQGMEEMGVNLRDMFGNMFPAKTVRKKLTIG